MVRCTIYGHCRALIGQIAVKITQKQFAIILIAMYAIVEGANHRLSYYFSQSTQLDVTLAQLLQRIA